MAGSAPTLGSALDPELREDLERVSASVPVDDGGGSSPLKLLVLAELIVARGLERVVEIGVYRGRLMLPLARLMARLGRGEVVGIDPYSATAAVQRDVEREGIDLVAWPETIDWDGIYHEVTAAISRWGLEGSSRLLRMRSEEAATTFAGAPIDMLHVDGNHDQAAVQADVDLYLPHMAPAGLVVMDDISWPSVKPVYERLAEHHEVLFSLVENGVYLWPQGGPNDFAILRIEGSARGGG